MPRTRRLERELSAVVDKNQSLAMELGKIHNDFESARIQERNLAAEFERRITDIEAERDTAYRQLHDLKTHLKEATARQESAATQIRHLENRLIEEHERHESILETMHLTLTQVRSEQQALYDSQSDLGGLVRNTELHLLEVIRAESSRPHTPVLAVSFIAVLVLLNTLAGAASIWFFRQEFQQISVLTNDLKLSIEEHISTHKTALEETTAQNDVQVSRGPDKTGRVASLSGSSNPGKPDHDSANTRHGDSIARAVGETRDQTVSFSDTRAEPPQGESPTLQQARINGYTQHHRYESARWGPPLLLGDPQDQDHDGASGFDPLVKELQTNLLVLGFNLGQGGADGYRGRYTEQALQEFQILYEPVFRSQQGTASDNLAAHVRDYANLAKEDEKKYKIASEILSAIRLSNLRTGMEFSFLMELAAVESTFNPGSRAAKSTAAGLYQFKRDTWLETVKRHGRKYGIGSYAKQVEYIVDSDGNRHPMISNPVVSEHVLDLRHNPRVAALMAAEYLKGNLRQLSLTLDQEPGRKEMYLTHFLGLSGAIRFLEFLDRNPHKLASDIFPGPALRNKNIFQNKNRKPRTVAEVYDLLGRKFSDVRYKDWRVK